MQDTSQNMGLWTAGKFAKAWGERRRDEKRHDDVNGGGGKRVHFAIIVLKRRHVCLMTRASGCRSASWSDGAGEVEFLDRPQSIREALRFAWRQSRPAAKKKKKKRARMSIIRPVLA